MADEQEFPLGTVVMLKSGGPKMTVIAYDVFPPEASKRYQCEWRDNRGTRTKPTWEKQSDIFYGYTLCKPACGG